jgi:RecB family exonuclease
LKKKASIKKYSHSSLKLYKQCPRRFYYNYIEKLPRKSWAHNILGNVVHSALEHFHGDYSGSEQLSELMSESFKKAYKENKNADDKIMREAKDLLAGYLDKVGLDGMPDGVMSVEKTFSLMVGKYKLIGVIDRIDKVGDKYYIWDYKTTKKVEYLDDSQLALYSMWFFDAHKDVDNITAGYILLRHGSSVMEYNFSRAGLASLKDEIAETCSEIMGDSDWEKSPSGLCGWCDFIKKRGGPCDGQLSSYEWNIQ